MGITKSSLTLKLWKRGPSGGFGWTCTMGHHGTFATAVMKGQMKGQKSCLRWKLVKHSSVIRKASYKGILKLCKWCGVWMLCV